jgi:hypothetical protein
MPIANLPFFLIQGEAFQGQKRTNHVFSHPLGRIQGKAALWLDKPGRVYYSSSRWAARFSLLMFSSS